MKATKSTNGVNLASESGGSGWNRTADRRLMSPLLYLLSYATNSKNIP